MRRMWIAALAVVMVGATVTLAPAVAEKPRVAQSLGVAGKFSLIMMVHTTSSSFGDLPGVNPWDGRPRSGVRYVYRSIPCSGDAPVNNISSDLPSYNTRVKDSRVPSSMRAHPFSYRLVKEDGKWFMAGRITFTVCKLGSGPTPADDPVADADKPKIRVSFKARFVRVGAETLRWNGRFQLRGGTGRYEGLSGSGEIAGFFLCFAPAGCAASGGKYFDGQMVLHGGYRDPTPQLGR